LLVAHDPIDVWFSLPYTDKTIECSGRVVWTDGLGRAGVQFTSVPETARQALSEWLSRYVANSKS
jgi:hypothetical protein